MCFDGERLARYGSRRKRYLYLTRKIIALDEIGTCTHSHGMTDKDAILRRVDRLHEKSGLAVSTISTRIFKDGKRVAALKSGRRVWPETLAEAAKELASLEANYGIKVRA